MASDQQQRSMEVPMHKRIAQGEKLDGTSLKPKGNSGSPTTGKGGLSHAKKK
jgi:hypothetical protein